jgi:Na+/H+-dicarboxylate symporter
LSRAPSGIGSRTISTVTAAPSVHGLLSGRVLVFAHRVEPGAAAETEIDTSPFAPTETAVAAREIDTLAPGQVATVVALAVGINPILDMFETCCNVTGDNVCTYIVSKIISKNKPER